MSRREAMVEMNTLLRQKLPNAVVLMRDETVKLDPDGCYRVSWGKESQVRPSYQLCPTAMLSVCIVDCFGKDGEYADLMYENLRALLESNTLRHSAVVRCQGEVLYSDETQTDAVRGTVVVQYVA